ncbi:MAG: transcription antitermination factor NusB [Bacteroidetes bacterium]|nr:transcription antitermination factor NusB [Bacteroidota bacterium]
MLSRRQLRIKVLQALYAFFQAEKSDLAIAEREMIRSVDKVYELYIYLLLFVKELADSDQNDADDLHTKFFPNKAQLAAKHRLFNLRFILEMEKDPEFIRQLNRTKMSWQKEQDLIRKIFLEIKKSEEYRQFLENDEASERDFLTTIFKKFIEKSEAIQHHIEEKNIFWNEDFDFIMHIIGRTMKSFYDTDKFELMPLYKDEEDDKEFARKLFNQTILHNKEFEEAISERTKNWEVDRIALMDILILKMALTELITFPNIPVKVTINEFIDISKDFSTPKSKQFVNGVLDKLAIDYKEQGKINKTGRGLLG